MTANDSKPKLLEKKKTVDEYNNIYHCSIGKKPIDADYFALSEKI